jgi:hypothetical protein
MLEENNVEYKNVGRFCKMLTKITINAEEKIVVTFFKNVETFLI